jgi:hypothetical protein
MLTRLKAKLGIGRHREKLNPAGPAEESGAFREPIQVNVSKSMDTTFTDQSLSATVRQNSQTPIPQNQQSSDEATPLPQLVPTSDVLARNPSDDGGELVARERVGRVSNRLSKRAEVMRAANQANLTGAVGANHQLVSQTLRTLESLNSTTSQAEYFIPAQTITIFDWDDTLCPSHWIRINRPRLQYFQPCPEDPKYKVPLETLSDHVIKVLRSASSVSKTVILTNAQVGWVEISCRNFLPRVWPVIEELSIEVVYARQSVEGDIATSRLYNYNYNANAPQLWKERAMKDFITKFYSQYLHQSWKNIVSIGDQFCEHDALRVVSAARPSMGKKCRVKTVKLLEEPTLDNLIAETQVINQWLFGLIQHDGDLSADLTNDDDVLFDLHELLAKN